MSFASSIIRTSYVLLNIQGKVEGKVKFKKQNTLLKTTG